jgi:TRAP transporter TAXI family solute receptor
MKKICVLLLVLVAVSPIFATGAQQSGSGRPEVYSLATAGLGGTYYIVGAGLGEVITQKVPHLTVNAIISGGSTGNPTMLGNNEAELGITNYISAANARAGRAPFNNPIAIAGIAPLQYSTLHIMVMGNRNDINTLADLRGKRVNLGPAAGGGALFFREMLPAWGLSESDFSFSFLSYNEGTEALRDGRIDANTPNGAAPLETVSSLASLDSVKLISLETANMNRVRQNNPYYDTAIIPGGTYRGINQDVQTGGIQDILVVREDMSEENVYQITKAIFESLEDLRKVHPSIANLRFDGYKNSLVPLHPGALRFYRERGIPIE